MNNKLTNLRYIVLFALLNNCVVVKSMFQLKEWKEQQLGTEETDVKRDPRWFDLEDQSTIYDDYSTYIQYVSSLNTSKKSIGSSRLYGEKVDTLWQKSEVAYIDDEFGKDFLKYTPKKTQLVDNNIQPTIAKGSSRAWKCISKLLCCKKYQ